MTRKQQTLFDEGRSPGANLQGADLRGAELRGAELSGARGIRLPHSSDDHPSDLTVPWDLSAGSGDLTKANLTGADLTGAKLDKVQGIRVERLEQQAKSLEGAIMPDGRTHS